MFKRLAILSTVVGTFTLAVYLSSDRSTAEQGEPPVPEMKFNDVKELAPGVFFRYSSISATDPKIPFGGCNNIWVVFMDYVFVVDANFPKEAGDVLADIKKTTKKPIDQILKDIDRDYYMTAEEAREYGLVDQIFSKEMRTGQSALT